MHYICLCFSFLKQKTQKDGSECKWEYTREGGQFCLMILWKKICDYILCIYMHMYVYMYVYTYTYPEPAIGLCLYCK